MPRCKYFKKWFPSMYLLNCTRLCLRPSTANWKCSVRHGASICRKCAPSYMFTGDMSLSCPSSQSMTRASCSLCELSNNGLHTNTYILIVLYNHTFCQVTTHKVGDLRGGGLHPAILMQHYVVGQRKRESYIIEDIIWCCEQQIQ